MLDALMATALVALAGTTIVTIAMQLFQQQEAELDRSVALVMSQSLMHQYLALRGTSEGSFPVEDERYSYSLLRDNTLVEGTRLLETLKIVARPKSGNASSSQQLQFLSPVLGPRQ